MSQISHEELRALAEFRYQIRRFLEFSETAARQAGVEPRQHQLLLAIAGLPEGERATVGCLAGRLVVRHHTAVELIGRSERQGLVARRRGEQDRREVLVELTEQGREALERLSRVHRQELRVVGPRLLRSLEAASEGGEP